MTEMVERVAKAIARADGDSGAWMEWVGIARAAIEAMREPTEAMCVGVDSQVVGCCNMADDDALECWQSMIDAALK